MSLKRGHILFLLLFLSSQLLLGQDKHVADSLKKIYWSHPSSENNRELLNQILDVDKEPDSMLKYSSLLIRSSIAEKDKLNLMKGYSTRGVGFRYLGDHNESLEDLYKAWELAKDLEQSYNEAIIDTEIGNTFSESGDTEQAIIYYDRGFRILREIDSVATLGSALYNIGDNLYEKKELDSALAYTLEARKIFRDMKLKMHEAYAEGNLGRIIFAQGGDLERAEASLLKAIPVLEKLSHYNALTDFYSSLSDINKERGNEEAAILYAEKSLEAAEKYKMKTDLVNMHLKLSQLYEDNGNIEKSFEHFKTYALYKDSIQDVESVKKMANLRSDFEISKSQAQIDLLNERQKNQQTIVVATIVALFLIVLIALGLYRRNKYIGRTKKIIEKEKNRSEILLLNILPQETANELKEKGKVQAKRFDSVSILFTDFKNFTHYAENLSPEELVKSVDFYFSEFDRIVEKYKLEKIKTVGDAYMCAAGVPFPVHDHAENLVAAALEMIRFVNQTKEQDSKNETRFDVRIGINSGPVVAGVVGSKKFAYDIWGDAVNIAARMETTSEAGKVNISEYTYELVKHRFECEYRGEVQVKNKGMMKMYFVKGEK
jgi:class 3 adenylate cyclase